MAAYDELKRLLSKAKAIPFRRIGRIQLAYEQGLPQPTLTAATAAVKAFARSLVEQWGEASEEKIQGWTSRGMLIADICDDHWNHNPAKCDPQVIVNACRRYHFRLTVKDDGKLLGVADDGWDMSIIRRWAPRWLVDVSLSRRLELVEAVGGVRGVC